MMQYYEDALMEAEEIHDPEQFEGREGDELENWEREEVIDEIVNQKDLVGYARWVNNGGIRGLDKEGAKRHITAAMKDDSLCRYSREDVDFLCERAEVSRETVKENNKRAGNYPLKENN